MKRFIRRIVWLVVVVLLLVGLHWVLIQWMAHTQAAAEMLSAGPHTPVSTILLVGIFMFVRLVMLIVMPGVVISRVGVWLYDLWQDRPSETTTR